MDADTEGGRGGWRDRGSETHWRVLLFLLVCFIFCIFFLLKLPKFICRRGILPGTKKTPTKNKESELAEKGRKKRKRKKPMRN